MKKDKGNVGGILSAAANIFELPPEVVLKTPLVTMTGKHKVGIENYTSLSEYTAEQIRVITSEGVLRVCGKGLEIVIISDDEIVIGGDIAEIGYC